MLRQDFDGDVSSQPRIARPIDLAHPARAQRRRDLIGPEFGSRAYQLINPSYSYGSTKRNESGHDSSRAEKPHQKNRRATEPAVAGEGARSSPRELAARRGLSHFPLAQLRTFARRAGSYLRKIRSLARPRQSNIITRYLVKRSAYQPVHCNLMSCCDELEACGPGHRRP